jgi:hypothetical protein
VKFYIRLQQLKSSTEGSWGDRRAPGQIDTQRPVDEMEDLADDDDG